ncbi:MAG TPA: YetF domain-containing protein [Anaerolineae bacterium]
MNGVFGQWLAAVFSSPDLPGALAIAGKTAVIYIFLVAGLRLLGKRELGQMSIYDLVLIVVIANSVQNAMVGQDTTLVGGLVAALTLLILNRAFTWLLVSNPRIKHLMLGEPVLIVRNGRMLLQPMRREGITRDHVLAAMREHGIAELSNVQMAVLEDDGAISIVPKEATVQRTHRRFRGLRVT